MNRMGKPKSRPGSLQKKRKARLLTKRELQYILERLRSADMGIFAAFVKKHIEKNEAVQLSFYEDRRRLWCTWNEDGRLTGLLSFLLSGFYDLLEQHTKGGERFARFLVSWHNFVGTLACNPEGDTELEARWCTLTDQLDFDVSSESRSALVFAVASASYTFLQKQVQQLQASWITVQCQAVEKPPEPDDDTSLYRLFGFSLFAGISFRKRVVHGRLRKRFTRLKRNYYGLQLKLLKTLLENDKSCLPACLKFQDRGKMMFPHRDLLPFCRECSLVIKTYLNPSMYTSIGRNVMQVARKQIMRKEDLVEKFMNLLESYSNTPVSVQHAYALFKEIIGRVLNTMANSFFACQDTLERISENKCVDAQVSLRDKLKVYAGEMHTQLTF